MRNILFFSILLIYSFFTFSSFLQRVRYQFNLDSICTIAEEHLSNLLLYFNSLMNFAHYVFSLGIFVFLFKIAEFIKAICNLPNSVTHNYKWSAFWKTRVVFWLLLNLNKVLMTKLISFPTCGTKLNKICSETSFSSYNNLFRVNFFY